MPQVDRRLVRVSLGIVCLAAAACGKNAEADLGLSLPLQASSAHFRYHATSADQVIPGVLDVLEANRADVFSYFGLSPNDEVVDYYLFDDPASVQAVCNQPDVSCTVGRQIVTTTPVQYHELIHAYTDSLGSPPATLVEGVATAVSCFQEGSAGPAVPEWQDLIQGGPDRSSDFYNTSMRLVRYLILQFGPERFIDYYKHAPSGGDAAAFASHFQSYWSMSIDQAWTAADIGSRALVEPLCPCRAQGIAPSPEVQHLSPVADWAYLPLAVDPGTALMIQTTTGSVQSGIEISDCERSSPAMMGATSTSDASPGVTLVQLDARPWYISTNGTVTDDLRVSVDSPLRAACDAAGTLSTDATMSAITALLPRGSAPSYARLSVTGAPTLARYRYEGALRLCTDCSLSDCRSVPPYPSSIAVSDGAVLEFDPSSIAGTGLAQFLCAVGGS